MMNRIGKIDNDLRYKNRWAHFIERERKPWKREKLRESEWKWIGTMLHVFEIKNL